MPSPSDSPFEKPEICAGTPCCGKTPCVKLGKLTRNVTRGRKKRKRKPGSGSAVGVGGHTRSPRGPNAGKPRVRVDGYKRGKGSRRRRRRR